MPCGAVVHSHVMVDVLDAELGRVIEVRVLSIKFRKRSVDVPWFDKLCRAAFWRKHHHLNNRLR